MLLEAGEHRPLLYSGGKCGNIVICDLWMVGYVITCGVGQGAGQAECSKCLPAFSSYL